MLIGTGTDMIPDYVLESGFTVAERIKVLGFSLSKNMASLQLNLDTCLDKIKKHY
jgi:hypothetical protein